MIDAAGIFRTQIGARSPLLVPGDRSSITNGN
jgi:hypothetical protein